MKFIFKVNTANELALQDGRGCNKAEGFENIVARYDFRMFTDIYTDG